MIDGSSVR